MTIETGTFSYIAPEVLTSQHYTKACDIYSFGITLWEMVTRTQPYNKMNNMQVAMGVIRTEHPLRPSIDDVKLQEWKSLIIR